MKLELYFPTKELYITQRFGETALLPYYKANGVNFVGHNGMDFATKHGEPIRASHDGIAFYQVDKNQGHGVVLITDKKYEYGAGECLFKTIYWHLCDAKEEPNFASPVYKNDQKKGTPVKVGDIIGYADSTGLSTGDHLHFGLKPVQEGEPKNSYINIAQNNGYQGAIDPMPYFNGKYAEDAQKFIFSKDITWSDENEDVRQLQKRLKTLGFFNARETGYYGEVTRDAVYAFQLKYVKLSWWAKVVGRGQYCHKATREALNKLI